MAQQDPYSYLPLKRAEFYILLALAGEEQHGYSIMQEVAALTDGAVQLRPGTLYTSIKRMVDVGLIEESNDRPDPELDDQRRRYYRLTDLVYGIVRRDHVQALPYLEESYRLAKDVGDLVTASYAIRHIGFAQHAEGDGDAAYAAMAASLHLRERAGFVPGVAMALHTMAYAEAEYGDKTKAIGCLERARSIFESLAVAKQVAWLTTEIEQFQ